MTDGVSEAGDDISLFALGSIVLRNRRRVLSWTVLGAVLAGLSVITKPAMYKASASFVSQGNDPARSGIASLAGQFGVALPTSSQSYSPDFYSTLLKSRELLGFIARDTFAVAEQEGRRVPFATLFDLEGESSRSREEIAIKMLGDIITVSVSKPTGIVEASAVTRWPSVSLAIVRTLIARVNEFNQNTRRQQAAAERRFVEGRVAVVGGALRNAEDRLQRFLQGNRQYASSPELNFERDRLQRDVLLQQQVFNALTQSYEEVRIREVRDTPVITMVESPAVPTRPQPRGRLQRVFFGLVLGFLLGVVAVVTLDSLRRRKQDGSSDASEFLRLVDDMRSDVSQPLRWFRRAHS